jgi:hypothetical protein
MNCVHAQHTYVSRGRTVQLYTAQSYMTSAIGRTWTLHVLDTPFMTLRSSTSAFVLLLKNFFSNPFPRSVMAMRGEREAKEMESTYPRRPTYTQV